MIFITCCSSDDEARKRSNIIGRELRAQKHRLRRTVKVLLLGSGESGKSTFLKQMRILHGERYATEELLDFRPVIYSNVVKGVLVMLAARSRLAIPWHGSQTAAYADRLRTFDSRAPLDQQTFSNLTSTLSNIWSDLAIQEAFRRRTEYQLTDCVRYFLDNIERIGRKQYLPTTQDILHSRKATTSIHEYDITIHDIPFKFVDVGGQRSQRQKWYQCFESVASILFIVSSSEYDQVLFEDQKTNRLRESLDIYDTVINNKLFSNVCVIVFLNKSDLLEEKVATSNIRHYFPDFTGDPRRLKDVQHFQRGLFESRMRCVDRTDRDYFHCTNATDTGNINKIFAVVRENILRNNLSKINIMLK